VRGPSPADAERRGLSPAARARRYGRCRAGGTAKPSPSSPKKTVALPAFSARRGARGRWLLHGFAREIRGARRRSPAVTSSLGLSPHFFPADARPARRPPPHARSGRASFCGETKPRRHLPEPCPSRPSDLWSSDRQSMHTRPDVSGHRIEVIGRRQPPADSVVEEAVVSQMNRRCSTPGR